MQRYGVCDKAGRAGGRDRRLVKRQLPTNTALRIYWNVGFLRLETKGITTAP